MMKNKIWRWLSASLFAAFIMLWGVLAASGDGIDDNRMAMSDVVCGKSLTASEIRFAGILI